MYGTNVKVEYKGKIMKVMVFHGKGRYEERYLQKKALQKLKVIEVENPSLTLDEIQEKLGKAEL